MSPEAQLQRHIGTRQLNVRRNVHYLTTAEAVEAYAGVVVGRGRPQKTLLILTEDDEVHDYRLTLEQFRNTSDMQIIIYPEGGHTLQLKTHPALDDIGKFIRAE